MKNKGRIFLAGLIVLGVILGLAATANSTQAGGFLQSVPTRGPSPTATVPTRAAESTSEPPAASETAALPAAASATPTPSATFIQAASASASPTAATQEIAAVTLTPTQGDILTKASDTPAPPSSISANTVSPAATTQPASSGGPPGSLLVAGPLALIVLAVLFFGLRGRKKTGQ